MKTWCCGLLILIITGGRVHALSLEEALRSHHIQVSITGNPVAMNIHGSSHTGRCLRIQLLNTGKQAQTITIPNACHFRNERKEHQDLVSCEQTDVVINGGQHATIAINALCSERYDGSPTVTDTFIFQGPASGPVTRLCTWLQQHHLFDNTAQQAMWCLTDDSPIDNIYDTHADTVIENQLARLVAGEKGVPVPQRFQMPHRILRYAIEAEGRYRQWIDRPTRIGIYITDSSNTILITLMDEETETRTGGNLTYTYGYRGLLPAGTYFLQARVNGAWKKEKEIVVVATTP